MSVRSDNAPVRFERVDYDTACSLCVSIIVNDVQHRQMVTIRDEDDPALIGAKLIGLGTWIAEKAAP